MIATTIGPYRIVGKLGEDLAVANQ